MPAALPFTHCITCGNELKRSNIVRGNCMTCHRRLEYQNNEIVRRRVIRHTRNWQIKNPDRIKDWKTDNVDRTRECARIRYSTDVENSREKNRLKNARMKHRAIVLVGRGDIKCINCGCNREELLQINHKNGGGSKERRETCDSGTVIYGRIVSGRRGIEDLELRCYACNALHYMELKYGKLPIGIVWRGED